jgi:hypothetical protein
MQRLRPVTFWLRALWLGLALMLPLHAMATGLGWCPMSAVARAVFAIDAHTAHVVHADPHAHCAEQAPSGLAGDPSTAVVAAGADASHTPGEAQAACVLCAAHASTAAWVPQAFTWGLDPVSQQPRASLTAPPADAFVAGLERPPRG